MRDPAGYRAPLALAVAGRRDDGSYVLGTVVVAGERGGGQYGTSPAGRYRLLLPLITQLGAHRNA